MDKLKGVTAVGYKALLEYLQKKKVKVFPFYRESYILPKGGGQIIKTPEVTQHYYRKSYAPQETPLGNLEFALKHEGLNLELIQRLLDVLPKKSITEYVLSHPTGKYNRIVWFLYEWLLQKELDIPDIKNGGYIDLLDSESYYTTEPIKLKRYRINDNLLGNRIFCPFIRKSEKLIEFEKLRLDKRGEKIISEYDPQVISRALHYLYAKETMSSYEIERERPSKKRTAKFISLLEDGGSVHRLNKERLIELQNLIVDPRFADHDYREIQNYIGETIGYDYHKVHYISPKADDVSELMEGLLESYQRMSKSDICPVMIASAISFGLDFIHPFVDGNGRLHRFLIHHILSIKNFTPEGVIFPISATMLDDMKHYDECLESFSSKLVPLVDFEIDNRGEMTVLSETKLYYQYIDYTIMTEFLYECIEKTIDKNFKKELNFLANYDRAKKEIQEIIDMPDRLIDLFIKFTTQNNGKLSQNKRKDYFEFLTAEELKELEQIIGKVFT